MWSCANRWASSDFQHARLKLWYGSIARGSGSGTARQLGTMLTRTMSRSCPLASSTCRSKYFCFFCRLEMSSPSDDSSALWRPLIEERGCSMNLLSAACCVLRGEVAWNAAEHFRGRSILQRQALVVRLTSCQHHGRSFPLPRERRPVLSW